MRLGGICPAAQLPRRAAALEDLREKSAETNVCVILPCFTAFPAAMGARMEHVIDKAGGIER